MELGHSLEQQLTVTPQLILANTLLRLSAAELEQVITQELAENPALELAEVQRCPRCGRPLTSGRCLLCDPVDAHTLGEDHLYGESIGDSTSFSEDGDGDDDGISRLASWADLSDHLSRQVHLSLPTQDWPVAAYLVENLDDHGFLDCELDEAASFLGVSCACVERVLSALQRLDPVGVAARDARECLLIQLEHLRREGIDLPLAEALVADHWEALSRRSFAEIAQATGTTVDQVQVALQFIRDNLNPFPAHVYWADLHEPPPEPEVAYLYPDVVITKRSIPADEGSGEYEIELPGARMYRLHISDSYLQALRGLEAGEQDAEQWEALGEKARLFISGVERRWQTLYRLARRLVDCQRDFLAQGEQGLHPLTRARLAEGMGVHESTVSRAVSGKYAQLPCGRIVPLARFFDSAAPLKEALKEIIAGERKPLSDREIAKRLAERGYQASRRTVAKYRNALNILPSHLR